MVVSTERPKATAASEAPAPRWAVTKRSCSCGAGQQLRGSPAGPGVAEPVKAEAANAPALPPFSGYGVGGGLRRHVGVKGRVEAGNLGQVPAKRSQRRWRPRRGVVQGCEVGQCLEDRIDPFVEEDGLNRTSNHRGPPGGPPRRCRGARPGRSSGRRSGWPLRAEPDPSIATRWSEPSSRRSLRLLEPALTTRIFTVPPCQITRGHPAKLTQTDPPTS